MKEHWLIVALCAGCLLVGYMIGSIVEIKRHIKTLDQQIKSSQDLRDRIKEINVELAKSIEKMKEG